MTNPGHNYAQGGPFRFTLYTKPVGQMRARAKVICGRGSVHKDPKQEQREQTFAALLVDHKPPIPLDGPIRLSLSCFFPIPSSKPKKWKLGALAGEIRPTTKPDADNLAKHIKDVMTQVGFWRDDKQVVELMVRKLYADLPRWEVSFEVLGSDSGASEHAPCPRARGSVLGDQERRYFAQGRLM